MDGLTIHAPKLNLSGALEINRESGRIPANVRGEGEDLVVSTRLASLESKVLLFKK